MAAMFRAESTAHPSAAETINIVLRDFVNVDENLETRNNIIMRFVCDYVIEQMKNTNPLFKFLYREIFYTGSYYDNLRVNQANEFDLDVILELPFNKNQYEIMPSPGSSPGYVQYYLKNSVDDIMRAWGERSNRRLFLIEHKFSKLFSNDGRKLLQNKVIEWLQSIIAMSELSNGKTLYILEANMDVKLRFSRSGPAWNLKVELQNSGYVIDVDFVLAIHLSDWPSSIKKKNWIQFMTIAEDKLCMLIPKASKNSMDPNYEWRISLPRVERFMIKGKQCVKPLIRIIKALRDSYEWTFIASYHIKTLFLHEIDKNYYTRDYWNMKHVKQRLIEVLEMFQFAVEKSYLPNFFFAEDNMFAHIEPATAVIVRNTLESIILKINNNFDSLYDIFKERHRRIHVLNSRVRPTIAPPVIVTEQPAEPESDSFCNIL